MFDVAVINEIKTNKECNSKDCVVRRKVCVTLKMKISSNDCAQYACVKARNDRSIIRELID